MLSHVKKSLTISSGILQLAPVVSRNFVWSWGFPNNQKDPFFHILLGEFYGLWFEKRTSVKEILKK